MLGTLTTSTVLTIILVYAILNAIKSTALINRKYLPLLGTIIGMIVGLVIGYFNAPTHTVEDIVLGALSGSNSTWLDQVIKKFLGEDLFDDRK